MRGNNTTSFPLSPKVTLKQHKQQHGHKQRNYIQYLQFQSIMTISQTGTIKVNYDHQPEWHNQ